MSEDTRDHHDDDVPEDQEGGDQTARESDDDVQMAADAEDGELQLENAALKERLLRAMADAENTRKRAEKDVSEARKFAMTAFARDLLSVADNMERAAAAAKDPADSQGELLANLAAGVGMVERELIATFERHGVTKLEPKGERFDPNLHQAVAEIPSSEPKGVVVEVTQPGYLIGDRVLRAAMVVLSNGHAASQAPEDSSSGEKSANATPGASLDTTA